MNKHQEVLERFLEQCQERQRTMSLNADLALNDGHSTDAGYFRREANEAQERVNAIRHALEIMAKAETLPKTADGVTVWPGGPVYWNGKWNGKPRVFQTNLQTVLNTSHAIKYYSTPQAARDAAGKGK